MVSVYELVEKARKTGKVEKGTNEVTKAIERGTAKIVACGADVDPKGIVKNIPILCKEKNVPCVEADKKENRERIWLDKEIFIGDVLEFKILDSPNSCSPQKKRGVISKL